MHLFLVASYVLAMYTRILLFSRTWWSDKGTKALSLSLSLSLSLVAQSSHASIKHKVKVRYGETIALPTLKL